MSVENTPNLVNLAELAEADSTQQDRREIAVLELAVAHLRRVDGVSPLGAYANKEEQSSGFEMVLAEFSACRRAGEQLVAKYAKTKQGGWVERAGYERIDLLNGWKQALVNGQRTTLQDDLGYCRAQLED